METKTPRMPCPKCGAKLDRASGLDNDDVPTEGDITFCIKCGELLFFNKDLTFRLSTEEEHMRLSLDPRILHTQVIIRGFPRKRGRTRRK